MASAIDEEMAEDMQVLGIADEMANAPMECDIEEPKYEVWRDNLPALRVFLELETQWTAVCAPDGELIRVGINYASLTDVLQHTDGLPVRQHRKVRAQIRVMEIAALAEMGRIRNERREQRAKELEEAKQRQ